MTIQFDTFIQSNHFQAICNRQRGQWLEVGNAGVLRPVSGFFQKCWFVVRNFLSWGGVRERTAIAINEVCRRFFDEICLSSPTPLDSNSPILARYAGSIRRLANSIRRMNPPLCLEEFVQNITDLNRCPEVVEARVALNSGIRPALLSEGISGSYILHDRQRRPWAIFKPQEQEPGVKGNPKGFGANVQGFLDKIKIEPGTSYQREVAACALDHGHFAGVPLTTVAEMPRYPFGDRSGRGCMKGSFQKFIGNSKHAWEHYQILPWPFSGGDAYKIPAHEIHKIAILDIRTLNCDRHLKNFLVDDHWHVHPIDHGYTFPGDASNLRFNWMNFKQAKEPFSPEELIYIDRLDPKADAQRLKEVIPNLSDAALFRFEVANVLLKKAARRGLTVYQIGELMCGSHGGGLASLLKVFIPMPLDHPSYFETAICRRISRYNMEASLDREITHYLTRTGSPH